MKRKFLLFIALLAVSQLLYSQATINCFPLSDDYNTGSANSTDFTQTSLIKTESSGVEAGWARFDLSDIPAGATVQSVELNLYVAIDNFAYWQVMSIEADPLLGTGADLYADCTDGDIYATWQGNFPEPGWYVTDLGATAVSDLQAQLEDAWFAVGVWEYELGGTYAITCDGWEETNPPYIAVTYLQPGAPLPAYNPYPPHNSMGVDPEVDLTWDFGADTDTYDLFFGTDFPPATKVVDNAASSVSGSYDPGTMEFNTTYFWQVVSKNDDDFITPGPVWTFTTACDAWAMPIFEDFNTVVPPALPYCWIAIANSTSGVSVVSTLGYSGIDESYCAYLSNSSEASPELILISPQIEGGVAGKYVNFFAWGYSDLSIGTIADPADPETYNEVATITPSTGYLDYNEYEVFFTTYTGTDEYIAFKLLSEFTYSPVYIDNVLFDFAPTCPKPSDMYVGGSTTSSITVGWTENGTATDWNIEYGLTGFTPTGTPTESVSENPYEVTGLEAGTEYDFYVQADCGSGDVSYWVGPLTATTACVGWDVPFYEDFDALVPPEIPLCWSKLVNSSSIYADVYTLTYNGIDYSYSMYLYNSDDANAELFIISPPLMGGAAGKYVNFWAWGYSDLSAGTMSNPADPATYNEIAVYDLSNTYLNYQEFEAFFSNYTGDDEYIAFKLLPTNTYQGAYLDNMTFDVAPTCPKPTDLYAGGSTTTTATLGWSENGVATEWEIEYGLYGFTPDGEPDVTATTNPYELTGLEPSTVYEFYVRAYCSADEQSYWVGPKTFQTQCEAFDLPYMEGFEDAILPAPPVCNIVENTNGDDRQWFTTSDAAHEGFNSMRINYTCVNPMDDWFFSAPLNLVGGETYIVDFYYTSNSSYYLEKLEVKWGTSAYSGAMTSDPIFVDENINYAFTWVEGIGYFTPETDGIYYVGWHGYSITCQYNLYVDHITIDVAPTCLKPSDLYVESVTTTSGTVGWYENGDATQWNIEYGLEGFSPTGVANAYADSNPFEITGLEPGTSYDFYVQADCGDGDVSWWAGPETFLTYCVAFEVPIFEDFDNNPAPETPVCWAPLIYSTNQYVQVQTVAWLSYSAPNSLYLYNSGDALAELMLVTPMLIDPVNELWINFFARVGYSIGPEVIIGTLSDPTDASTFTEIGSVSLTTEWQEFEIFFDDYTGTDEFIAIKGGFTGTYHEIYIDNITIDHPPTCPKPSDLYSEDATQTSIMLGWEENGSATTWNVEYGYAGFTPTGVGNAVATENPFELTGLEDGTLYEFYVQADCGSGDESYWVGPRLFQTLCYPTVLAEGEYFEDFEGLTPPVIPPCIAIENSNNDALYWQSSFNNPYEGLSHMRIGYTCNNPMDDWFFTAPLELLGGQTYNVVFYYANNSNYYVEKLELMWGDAPTSDAMVNGPIFDDNAISSNNVYLEGSTSFTPEEDGVYFVGFHGYSATCQYDLYVDNIFIEWDNSLVVAATASPDTICQGAESQLNGGAVGGSGNYTYSWTSDPPGFTSSDPNPIVSPDVTTDYILEVNDSFVSIFDTVTVFVTQLPGVPGTPAGITFFCASWGNATYSTSGASGANWYDWELSPEDAGSLTGTGTSVTIDWTEGWLGMAQLKVIGMHDECAGPESGTLNINVYLPNVTLNTLDTACLQWPAFELTGGAPAGGVYTGPGVDDDGWFDPAVAGIGEHTITYTYTDPAACENYAEQIIVVDACTGISMNNGDMQIAINPNPNNGVFTLMVKAPNTEKVNIKVMNNFGEEVYNEDDVILHNNYSAKIDLSKYAEGLYYLYIYSDEVNYVEKIIVK